MPSLSVQLRLQACRMFAWTNGRPASGCCCLPGNSVTAVPYPTTCASSTCPRTASPSPGTTGTPVGLRKVVSVKIMRVVLSVLKGNCANRWFLLYGATWQSCKNYRAKNMVFFPLINFNIFPGILHYTKGEGLRCGKCRTTTIFPIV